MICEITAKEVLIECSTTELKSYNHLRDGNIQSGGNGCEIKGNGQVKREWVSVMDKVIGGWVWMKAAFTVQMEKSRESGLLRFNLIPIQTFYHGSTNLLFNLHLLIYCTEWSFRESLFPATSPTGCLERKCVDRERSDINR